MSQNNQNSTRGGSSEQHSKAGSQSHKNQSEGLGSQRGGPSQQHAQAGGSNKNQQQGDNTSASNRGGSSEQHAKAGSQSHKNN